MRRNILILLVTLFWSLSASAQDPCVMVTRMLGEAGMMVLDGNYEKALKLLRAVAADPETQGCSNLRLVKAKISEIEAKQQASLCSEQNTANGISFTIKGISFTMIRVNGGTFMMGSKKADNEKPVHQVTVSDYYIGETEVTQALWQAVMGSNPRTKWKGDNLPVESVGWDECQEFIRKLNQLTGRKFRLPTEAEWEFAARGGNNSSRTKYSGSKDINSVAWYDGNSGRKTHPVKTKSPNELGLYDMNGNVNEWCNDWWGNYSSIAQTNPQGPSRSGLGHVTRGGCWISLDFDCTVTDRGCLPGANYFTGLRLAL